jgi:signal transduction histidine kinase/ActR/RegA family two-component response regulator
MNNNSKTSNQLFYEDKIAHLPQIHFKHIISKFNKDLENEFFDDYFSNSLGLIRVTLILSLSLVAIFGILDIWILPISKIYAWTIRFIFICPAILICLILSLFKLFKRIMQLALCVATTLVGSGFVIMIAGLHQSEQGFYLYYVGILQVIIASYTLLRIRFVYASIVGWILVISYIFIAIFFNNMLSTTDTIAIFLNNNFFLISTNIMGMIAGFFIEFYIRHTFLLRKRIQYEEELKIEKTEQELAKTKEELTLVQHTLQSMELETDAGLRNISHTIRNKHAVQKGMGKNLIKKMLMLKEAVRELENKIPEAFNKSITSILNYFEKMIMDKIGGHNGGLESGEYKKYISGLKENISHSFEKKNIEKIKTFISRKIEQYSQEAIISLDELYENMNSIIDYIFAIIAYQRGKEIDIKEHVNATLKRVYYNILDTYEKELQQYKIEFAYESHTDEVVVLQVYDFILEEDIIRNLFLNSFRALVEDDPDNIRTDKKIWIEVDLERDEQNTEYYIIRFMDNGPGIPEDKKQQIFEGYSSKRTGRRFAKGAGLIEHGVGLNTVKKRVEEIGGSITEQGRPGAGAEFVLRINKYVQKPSGGEASELGPLVRYAKEVDVNLKNKKALIVDDTQAIREELGIILKTAGLTIIFASNLEEARDKIYNNYDKPDIIILDLDLGVNKGEELLFELMGKKEGKIPVVVVSGSDRAYYEDKLKSLNATAVFQKPVNDEQLIKSVQEILAAPDKRN